MDEYHTFPKMVINSSLPNVIKYLAKTNEKGTCRLTLKEKNQIVIDYLRRTNADTELVEQAKAEAAKGSNVAFSLIEELDPSSESEVSFTFVQVIVLALGFSAAILYADLYGEG